MLSGVTGDRAAASWGWRGQQQWVGVQHSLLHTEVTPGGSVVVMLSLSLLAIEVSGGSVPSCIFTLQGLFIHQVLS